MEKIQMGLNFFWPVYLCLLWNFDGWAKIGSLKDRFSSEIMADLSRAAIHALLTYSENILKYKYQLSQILSGRDPINNNNLGS